MMHIKVAAQRPAARGCTSKTRGSVSGQGPRDQPSLSHTLSLQTGVAARTQGTSLRGAVLRKEGCCFSRPNSLQQEIRESEKDGWGLRGDKAEGGGAAKAREKPDRGIRTWEREGAGLPAATPRGCKEPEENPGRQKCLEKQRRVIRLSALLWKCQFSLGTACGDGLQGESRRKSSEACWATLSQSQFSQSSLSPISLTRCLLWAEEDTSTEKLTRTAAVSLQAAQGTMDGVAFYYSFYVISILTCIFGCVANLYIIWLFRFHMEKTTFRTYVVNLAAADLGTVAFLAMALILHASQRPSYVFPYAIYFAMCMASLCFLVAVSVNRCVSVLFPRRYQCCQPRCLSTRLAFSIWTLVGMFCAMEISFYFVYGVPLNLTSRIMFIMNFWILPSLLAVCTAVLLTGLCCRYRGHPPGRPNTVVILMLLFFLIFGSPCIVINSKQVFIVSLLAFEYTHLFFSVNSSIKPMFYALVGSQWKGRSLEPLIIQLQRVSQDEGNVTDGRDPTGVNLTAKGTCSAHVV